MHAQPWLGSIGLQGLQKVAANEVSCARAVLLQGFGFLANNPRTGIRVCHLQSTGFYAKVILGALRSGT